MEKELKRGVYVLAREVANPKPDRRSTRDWTKAVKWPKGLIVHYDDNPYPAIRAAGEYANLSPHSDEEGWAALVPALEPAPRNFYTVMLGLDNSPRSYFARPILAELVRMGKITLEDIEAAQAARYARPEDDDRDEWKITGADGS